MTDPNVIVRVRVPAFGAERPSGRRQSRANCQHHLAAPRIFEMKY